MITLAIDTSTATVSVALVDADGAVVADLRSDRAMKHGELVVPLIATALAAAELSPADLGQIVVGAGPGPFTGLRVGLVTARTMGFALGIGVLGVCSLDALALEAVESGEIVGEFQVATDARRKEVYLATYDASAVRLTGPIVDKPVVLASDRPTVGEGAWLYPDAFPHALGPRVPSAAWMARGVAEERLAVIDPEPLYLRRPDAETR